MSTNAGKSFGTQSPPLEATGQQEPMGVSSISGDKPKAASDQHQREQYFQGAETGKETEGQIGSGVPSQTEKTKKD